MKSIKRKTLLYKSGVEYADYGLNHVEGCSHGCKFPCYAYIMKKRCGIVKTYKEWIEPKIVENALELLDKELPRLKNKINNVFLCFSTDPFMYKQPEVQKLTLRILEKLNRENLRAILITKGVYPKELTNTKKFNKNNDYGSTIVWESDKYREKFEPGASPISMRIRALKALSEAGLKTWISMEPYPTPNIARQNVENILNKISFVDKIIFGKWNYNQYVSKQPNYKEFYNEMSSIVIDFCRRKSIDVHIKEGTISQNPIGKNKFILEDYLKQNSLCYSGSLIFNIN